MLERGTHAAGLHAVDEGCGHMSGEQRVRRSTRDCGRRGRRLRLMPGPRTTDTPCVRALVGDGVTGPGAPGPGSMSGPGDRRWKAGGGHAAGDAEMVAGAFPFA